MKIQTIQPFLEYYSTIRTRTKRLLAVVPEYAMDWSYKPGKFTIADHIRHIAAIERYMFAETIAGRPCTYRGCDASLADGHEAVMCFLDAMHEESTAIFSTLTDAALQEKCLTPAGTPITRWKWLRAMTEHEIHHRAQLYLYLNMLDITTPPMFGLSSEQIIEKSQLS